MKRSSTWRGWLGLAVLALALVAALASAMPAYAAGDTLTLSLTNGTTFPYDSSTNYPIFSVKLVVGASLNASSGESALITLTNTDTATKQTLTVSLSSGDGGTTWTGTGDGVTVYNGMNGPITIGAITAVATFKNTSAGVTDNSNSVSFTVNPVNSPLECGPGTTGNGIVHAGVWTPGQTVTFAMYAPVPELYYSPSWAKGTVTITFAGPTTVTYPNLPLNAYGAVTTNVPTTIGRYTLDCKVSGVPYYTFNDASYSSAAYLVTENQALGGVRLYTNPATFVAGQTLQMRIIFLAAPGLPTPTGQCSVQIGQSPSYFYAQSATIAADGTASLTLASLPNLAGVNGITIMYEGDPYYKVEYVNFPMTNPLIPGSGGSGAASGQASATATSRTTAKAGATGTPAGSSASGGLLSTAPTPDNPAVLGSLGPLSGGSLVALLALVGLLAIGSGVGTFLLLSRQGAAHASAGFGPHIPPAPPAPSAPTPPAPSGSPLDEDTLPQRKVERP